MFCSLKNCIDCFYNAFQNNLLTKSWQEYLQHLQNLRNKNNSNFKNKSNIGVCVTLGFPWVS